MNANLIQHVVKNYETLHGILVDAHVAPLSAIGVLHVEGAATVIGRFVAYMMNLPRPAKQARVLLNVYETEHGQLWHRVIGSQSFKTHQQVKNDARGPLLVEAFGIAAIGMELDSSTGTELMYTTMRTWLAGVPLPCGIAPTVTATVTVEGTGWNVDVRIMHTLLGTLCRYSGHFEQASHS